jgi:hypothetical protein
MPENLQAPMRKRSSAKTCLRARGAQLNRRAVIARERIPRPQERRRSSLEAEILFLRRQLALYMERGVKPRRIDSATRVSLAFLRAGSHGARRWSS